MGFHVSHSTWEINPAYLVSFDLQDYHLLWLIFPDYSIMIEIFKMPIWLHSNPVYSRDTPQTTHAGYKSARFRLFPFRSPLLGEFLSVSFPQGTEMVHFSWFASRSWASRYPVITRSGLPHSEISGSKSVCDYPKHIAAYRVLHRLFVPSHPLKALCSLTNYLHIIIISLSQTRKHLTKTKDAFWITLKKL